MAEPKQTIDLESELMDAIQKTPRIRELLKSFGDQLRWGRIEVEVSFEDGILVVFRSRIEKTRKYPKGKGWSDGEI